MNKNFSQELIERAKTAKSPNELILLAKEYKTEITPQEAEAFYESFHKTGELSDDELDNIAGGGCSTDVGGKDYTIVTSALPCFTGGFESNFKDGDNIPVITTDSQLARTTWRRFSSDNQCGSCAHLRFNGVAGYCGRSGK